MTDTVDKVIIQSETQGVQQSTDQLNQLGKSMDGVTVASQNVEKSTTSVEGKFAALERRLGTTQGQSSKADAAFRTINTALAQNPALADRAAEATAVVAAKYGIVTDAAKTLGAEHEVLSNQSQSLFHAIRSAAEQMALGVSPAQALTAQLNHLTIAASGEGGLTGAFSGVTAMAGRLVTSLVTPTTAIAALGAGALYLGNSWSESSAQVTRATIGIGAATGATTADLTNFAKANASATGLTIGEARNAAIEFNKTGTIAVQGLQGVGEAIHGYAVLTGQDATAATKTLANALSGDLVKGAQTIDQTYGALNSQTLEYIRTLELQGNRTQAIQVIIDAINPANQKAAESVGVLTKAYQALAGAMSAIKNGPTTTETPLQDRITSLQGQRDSAAQSGTTIGRNANNELISFASNAELLTNLDQRIADLQKQADAFNTAHITAELNQMSKAGDAVVTSIIPQIDQIHNLEQALATLQAAQNTPGVSRSLGTDDQAVTAIQNQIAALRDSQGEAARYNQQVAEISRSWGDVGQSTALSLEAAQNQLPVLEAVGGAAKMAAQYAADYATYINQGKTATEAAALAASNLAARQAQVTSAAKEQLAALRDQYAVASARTVQGQIGAQSQATYNSLLRQGVDSETAFAVASQQAANAQAQVYEQMQKAVKASQDQLDLARAAGTAGEAQVKSAIAYSNAIDAGATSAQAAAISTNVLYTETLRAAQAADQLAEAELQAARAAHDAQYADITPGGDNSFGFFQMKNGVEGNTAFAQSPATIANFRSIFGAQASFNAVDSAAASGSINAALNTLLSAKPGLDVNSVVPGGLGGILTPGTTYADLGIKGGGSTASDIQSAITQLYDLKANSASSNEEKASAYNGEIAYLQSQPQTLQTLTKIVDLKNSLDQLTKSTNNLNSTNQDLLSPYYSQDPRTSHIGFRSQGMATTGYIDIPGTPSANDNMTLTLPVASGERVNVTNGPGRGSNSVSQTITISAPITIVGGGNKDDIGRTVYQTMQAVARQLQASAR